MKYTQKKLDKSQTEVDFELDAEEFSKYLDRALNHLKEHVKVDGFRMGTVPLKMVEEKVGNENLLMEAGDLAVKDSYDKFIEENNLEPVEKPAVQILGLGSLSCLGKILVQPRAATNAYLDPMRYLPSYKQ